MINSNTQNGNRKSVECGSIAGILLLGVYAKCMGGDQMCCLCICLNSLSSIVHPCVHILDFQELVTSNPLCNKY